MKKKLLLLSLVLVMLFSSCASLNVDEKTKSFVDFFYDVYAPQDEMFGIFVDTVYDVATILTKNEEKGDEKIEEAMQEAISMISEAYKEIESTTISDIIVDVEMEKFMEEKGLDADELTAISEIARSNQSFYLEAFNVLLYSLETGVPDKEVELETVIAYAAYQHQLIYLYMQYDYYTLNGFFSCLSKDEIKYVKSYMKDNSVVFKVEGVEWQDSEENAVEQANLVWSAIEAFVGTDEE